MRREWQVGKQSMETTLWRILKERRELLEEDRGHEWFFPPRRREVWGRRALNSGA